MRLLGEVPGDVRKRRVTRDKPAKVLVVFGTLAHRPFDHFVIDFDHDVGDDAAVAQRGDDAIVVPPVIQIEAAVVRLGVAACPRIQLCGTIVVRPGAAFSPACVVGIGVQDNEVESVGGKLVEKRVDRLERRIVHVHRPQPIAFVSHGAIAAAVVEHEVMPMPRVDAQAAMHFGIGVFRTREANCPAIQIGNVRVSDRGPIAGRARGNAEFPNAFTVIEPARRETLSRRTSYRGRESGAKRVFRLGRAPKIEVVGLPLLHLRFACRYSDGKGRQRQEGRGPQCDGFHGARFILASCRILSGTHFLFQFAIKQCTQGKCWFIRETMPPSCFGPAPDCRNILRHGEKTDIAAAAN